MVKSNPFSRVLVCVCVCVICYKNKVYCACDFCQFSTMRHLISKGRNTGYCVVSPVSNSPLVPSPGAGLCTEGGSLYATAWLYECATSGRLVQINHSWCWKFTYEKGCSQTLDKTIKRGENQWNVCFHCCCDGGGGSLFFIFCYMDLNC